MIFVVLAGVIVAAAIVAVVAVVATRRSSAPVASGDAADRPPASPRLPPPAPMTDLESALAQVIDREGRPIAERIEAEAVHVDPLRDPEDTGPLLRRALDSVAHHDDEPAAHEPDGDDAGTATADEHSRGPEA